MELSDLNELLLDIIDNKKHVVIATNNKFENIVGARILKEHLLSLVDDFQYVNYVSDIKSNGKIVIAFGLKPTNDVNYYFINKYAQDLPNCYSNYYNIFELYNRLYGCKTFINIDNTVYNGIDLMNSLDMMLYPKESLDYKTLYQVLKTPVVKNVSFDYDRDSNTQSCNVYMVYQTLPNVYKPKIKVFNVNNLRIGITTGDDNLSYLLYPYENLNAFITVDTQLDMLVAKYICLNQESIIKTVLEVMKRYHFELKTSPNRNTGYLIAQVGVDNLLHAMKNS